MSLQSVIAPIPNVATSQNLLYRPEHCNPPRFQTGVPLHIPDFMLTLTSTSLLFLQHFNLPPRNRISPNCRIHRRRNEDPLPTP